MQLCDAAALPDGSRQARHVLLPQAQNGVVVAAFETKVDTLQALRINSSDVSRLFSSIDNATTSEVISAIVFRCQNRRRPCGKLAPPLCSSACQAHKLCMEGMLLLCA